VSVFCLDKDNLLVFLSEEIIRNSYSGPDTRIRLGGNCDPMPVIFAWRVVLSSDWNQHVDYWIAIWPCMWPMQLFQWLKANEVATSATEIYLKGLGNEKIDQLD